MAPDFKEGCFPCYSGPALRELKSKTTVCPLEEVQQLCDQIDRQVSPVLHNVPGPVSEQAVVESSTQQVIALHCDQAPEPFAQGLRERSFSAQDAPRDVHNVRCRADHSRPVETRKCILAPKRSSSPDRRYSRRRNSFHSCFQAHNRKLMHLQTSQLVQYKRYVQRCAICVCKSVQADSWADSQQ